MPILPRFRSTLLAGGMVVSLSIAHLGTASAVDGTWFQYTTLSRYGHSAVFDPTRQRMVVFGGYAATPLNDVEALSVSGPPSWTRLDAPQSLLPGLADLILAYDADNDRIVGVHLEGTVPGVLAFSATAPTTWSVPSVTGTAPSPRTASSWVLDPVGKRVLFFGGRTTGGSVNLNEVWALNLGSTLSWQQLLPGGTPPGTRYGSALAFDVARNRLVVFGGYGKPADPFAPDQALNDTWTLSLSGSGSPQWTAASPGGNLPAAGTAKGVFDAPRDRMLVFLEGGGISSLGFSSMAWSSLGGSPVENPPGSTIVSDPIGNRVIAFGGDFTPTQYNTWILDLGTGGWSSYLFGEPVPSVSVSPTLVFDPKRDRALLLGQGAAPANPWAFSPATATWTVVPVSGTAPAFGPGLFAFYDPYGDRLIEYGSIGSTTELWALPLSGPSTWTPLSLVGPAHPPVNKSLTYDPLGNRIIGYYGSLGTWILDLDAPPQWVNVTTSGTPPPTTTGNSFAGAYDAAHDDYVAAGGNAFITSGQNGTWSLDLGTLTWTTLAPLGTAPIECSQSLLFDPVGMRAVTFGGALSGFSESNDTKVIGLGAPSAWSTLAPQGRFPNRRRSHALAYDPVRDQLLTFGGTDDNNNFGDLWGLVWAVGGAPTLACGPHYLTHPGGQVHMEFVLANSYGFAQDASWELSSGRNWPGYPLTGSAVIAQFGNTTAAFDATIPDSVSNAPITMFFRAIFKQSGFPVACSRQVTIVLDAPNASAAGLALSRSGGEPGRELSFRVSLPSAVGSRLDVFDVGGRRVFARDLGPLGAGSHVVRVEGPTLLPGVYLTRLSTPRGYCSIRSVVIR